MTIKTKVTQNVRNAPIKINVEKRNVQKLMGNKQRIERNQWDHKYQIKSQIKQYKAEIQLRGNTRKQSKSKLVNQ